MTSTLFNQSGSCWVGLRDSDSLSSYSEPFDFVESLSDNLSNGLNEESAISMICSSISPEKPGETISRSLSANVIEVFDSKFDSYAPTAVKFAITDAIVEDIDILDNSVLVPGARFEPAPTADGLE